MVQTPGWLKLLPLYSNCHLKGKLNAVGWSGDMKGGMKSGSSSVPWLHGWPRPAPDDTGPCVSMPLLMEEIEQGRDQNHRRDKGSLLFLRKCGECAWDFLVHRVHVDIFIENRAPFVRVLGDR